MVRVISVHHFTHQDVAGLDKSGGHGVAKGIGDYLFIGGEHKIDVRDLKNGIDLKGTFSTVDLVQQLIYCQKGNYVCTLESKPARHGGDHTYVRVYLNWESDSSNQPMRARIAGRVTPSGQAGLEGLEMVEIPTRKPVEYIACCQTTGNLALVSGMSLSIFHFCHKTHDLSKIKFVDFEEMIEIDMAFVIKEMAIAEDLIGCVSDTEAHIFQVVINAALLKSSFEDTPDIFSPEEGTKSRSKSKTRSESRSPGRTSLNSLSQYRGKKVSQKEESVKLIRDSKEFVDLSDIKWVPTICYGKKKPTDTDSKFLLFPSLVGAAQCGTVTEPGEVLGPVSVSQCSNVRIKLLNGYGANQRVSIGIFDAVTLLHRRVDHISEPDLPFSNLQLTCVYDDSKSSKASCSKTTNHPLLPLAAEKTPKKVGASVFLTTPHVGYLYHISLGAETKDCSVVRGGVFSYTAPVDTVALEPYLLHALTLTGLETYTLRPHPYIIESYLSGDNDMIVPLHWEEAVCLVGLRPFLNVEFLTLTDSCLALIAVNEEGGDKSHTIYSLHLPSACSLYKEMIRVGVSHHTASPSTYLHLLLEAHVVLITSLRNARKDNSLIEEEEDILALLQDSSSLLGDYYAGCNTEVEWKQAVQYYRMSSLTPDAVLERLAIDSPGLVYILVSLLLDPTTSLLSPAQANAVLDIFEKVAPNKVSTVLLESTCLEEYKKDKVLNIIKHELSKTSDPQPTDVLALALIILEKGSHEQVFSVFSLLRSHELIEILIKHSKILLDYQDNQLRLSEITQVLVEYKKEVFIEVFVLMIGEGTISLDAFVDAYMTVYPIVSCGIECNINSLRLRDVLENFFLEFGHLPELTDQKEKYGKAVAVLIQLYLAALLGAFNSESEEKTCLEQRAAWTNLFLERPTFLNYMPPFNGKAPLPICKMTLRGPQLQSPSPLEEKGQAEQKETKEKEELTDVDDCYCRQCCVHLLILQSLLASNLPSSEDRANVLKFSTTHLKIKGAASLQVLCLDAAEQRTFLLDHHPKSLIHYCKNVYDSPWEWEGVIRQLIDRHTSLQSSDSQYEVIEEVLNEILGELMLTSSFDNLAKLIPKEQHDRFKGHLRQCHSAGMAQYLKDTFITYAGVVLQQMAK